MAYRNLAGIDEKILRAIWQLGAREGVKKITARKIGALCGVSDYTVFSHFGSTNRGFLDTAAKLFFSVYLDPLFERIAKGGTVGELWDETLRTLLTEPDGAGYFRRYCLSFGLDDSIFDPRRKEEIANALTVGDPALSGSERQMLLDHFLSCAFRYAESLSCGSIQDTAENRDFLRSLICRTFGTMEHSDQRKNP